MKVYEIRDPIFGFITINDWEREIIDHRAFQRLRRIRQLAWTDMVYPGATHTRFEHSLGVMKIATEMFNSIVQKRKDYIKSELNFTDDGFGRDRILVRLAALLHDVGHSPFSHAGEDLMPNNNEKNKPYQHEDYSVAIIRHLMKDDKDNSRSKTILLSSLSSVVKGLNAVKQKRVYVSLERKEQAKKILGG